MGFLIFIAVVGIVIYLASSATNANRQKWKNAARLLNLSFYQGSMGKIGRIAGQIHGHQVSISTFTRGSGNASQTYTRYTLEYREPAAVVFKANTQHMMHNVEKIFGLQDIELGDPAFDDRILLRGERPAEIIRFLTPKLREEIRLMSATYPDITITNNLVTVNKRGIDSDPAAIAHSARHIAGFCDIMSDAATERSGAHSDQDADFVVEADDLIIEPAEPPYNRPNPAVSEPVQPEIDEEKPVVEIEESVEKEEPVVQTTPPAAEDAPEEKVDELPVAEAAVQTMEEVEKPSPVESTASGPVDLEEAARELFGDSGSALLSSQLFEEHFKDRPVSGSGELTRVGKFSYDPVFANTKGVKATLTVCELPGTYSKIRVVAEVVYPPEQYEGLVARVDARLSVSGKLIAHDAMMHRLYVVAE